MTNGLIARKLGMTQYFAPDGRMHAVTVVEAGPCIVTQIKTPERDGYAAVQLGFGNAKHLSAAEKGHLGFGGLGRTRKRAPASPPRQAAPLGMLEHLREFEPAAGATPNVGDAVNVSIFEEGQLVDVTGVSKGKGFAGGIRRHHFRGGPKTHGQSDRHRAPGSVGSGTTPGRVLKGLRMAGHLGHVRVTAKNLEILRIDAERNLLFLRGAVPGPAETVVTIRKARTARKGAVAGAR